MQYGNVLSHFASTVSDDDYITLSAEVVIPNCTKRVCANVMLVDDMQLEEDEVFRVTLERTAALERNVSPEPGRHLAVVTIVDGDSTYNCVDLCS